MHRELLLRVSMLRYRGEELLTRPKMVLSTIPTLCPRYLLMSPPKALVLLKVGLTPRQLTALHPRPEEVLKTG